MITLAKPVLPLSFARDGFFSADQMKKPKKRLLIGTEGKTDTGKTEFSLSAPGPIMVLALDRMFDGTLDNPTPPPTRRKDIAFKVFEVPLVGTKAQSDYVAYWRNFYDNGWIKALNNPDVTTVVLDGDSDSWELQRLAEFGRLKQVPSLNYVDVNASRRAMIARAWDSGKIVIATNKVKDEYTDEHDKDGNLVVDDKGKARRIKSGESERQGFSDQDYLWHIQLRHLYKPAYYNTFLKKSIPQQWGIKLLKCKANKSLEGEELWGDQCNFAGLVQFVYPNIPLSEWGFK